MDERRNEEVQQHPHASLSHLCQSNTNLPNFPAFVYHQVETEISMQSLLQSN